MFAEAGVKLPAGRRHALAPRTSPRRSLSAIERNRGEIDVAPLPLRAGAALAGLAPELAASVARRLGSEQITRTILESQRGSQ